MKDSDKQAQLAILADALTKIVEVATIGPATTTPMVELGGRFRIDFWKDSTRCSPSRGSGCRPTCGDRWPVPT